MSSSLVCTLTSGLFLSTPSTSVFTAVTDAPSFDLHDAPGSAAGNANPLLRVGVGRPSTPLPLPVELVMPTSVSVFVPPLANVTWMVRPPCSLRSFGRLLGPSMNSPAVDAVDAARVRRAASAPWITAGSRRTRARTSCLPLSRHASYVTDGDRLQRPAAPDLLQLVRRMIGGISEVCWPEMTRSACRSFSTDSPSAVDSDAEDRADHRDDRDADHDRAGGDRRAARVARGVAPAQLARHRPGEHPAEHGHHRPADHRGRAAPPRSAQQHPAEDQQTASRRRPRPGPTTSEPDRRPR